MLDTVGHKCLESSHSSVAATDSVYCVIRTVKSIYTRNIFSSTNLAINSVDVSNNLANPIFTLEFEVSIKNNIIMNT